MTKYLHKPTWDVVTIFENLPSLVETTNTFKTRESARNFIRSLKKSSNSQGITLYRVSSVIGDSGGIVKLMKKVR